MTLSPVRARQSYRHEAFVWSGPDDFVQGLLPFIQEGLDVGEAVMVATIPRHNEWLSTTLGSSASEVHFVDMAELGRNPARIIPAWQKFLDDWAGSERPARGIGEPIWDGRGPEEILECQLHEALLNLAVDPDLPFWLVCPYDAEHLDEEVLAEASRSHPAITTTVSYRGSRSYRGHAHAQSLFAAALPDISERRTEISVPTVSLTAAVEHVILWAVSGDLASHKVVTLANAVRRLAGDSLHRGARELTVRMWDAPDVLICDVADSTVVDDLLVGRHLAERPGQDAVRLAHQACDLVQVRSNSSGTIVRIHMRR